MSELTAIGESTPSRSARVLDAAISVYQRFSAGRLPRCRFHPSCSQYAREAIAGHGAVRGTWLAARRLGRCQPFGGHGFDPVPDALTVHPLRSADPC